MGSKSRFLTIRRLRVQLAIRSHNKRVEESQSYIQSTLGLIGTITIAWASVELILNHLIAWHHSVSGKLISKDLPHMLSRKLKYLKKMESAPGFTDDQKNKFMHYRQEIDRLSTFRHNIIHGVLHQKNRYSLEWHTHSMKFGDNNVNLINATYSNNQIQDHANEISALASDMSPYIAAIVGIPHPENSE